MGMGKDGREAGFVSNKSVCKVGTVKLPAILRQGKITTLEEREYMCVCVNKWGHTKTNKTIKHEASMLLGALPLAISSANKTS